jgi:hypothetical protein
MGTDESEHDSFPAEICVLEIEEDGEAQARDGEVSDHLGRPFRRALA